MTKRLIQSSAIIMFVLGLVACGGIAATPTPVPTPTPAELSTRISQATRATQSMGFLVGVAGQPVISDGSGLFTIQSIEGSVLRPDGVRAALKLRSAMGIVEVRTVSLAGKQYVTNPLTRAWECLDAGVAFDVAALFDPESGIEYLLQDGFADITLVGEETLNDRPVYHLRGVIPGERLLAISSGVIGSAGPVATDLWADRETLLLTQIVLLDQRRDAPEPTTWTLTFLDYDQPVDVRAPVEC